MPHADKDEYNAYARMWYQKNKDKHLATVKAHKKQRRKEFDKLKMKPCMDCGFIPQDPCQMDWDHTDNNKIHDVSFFVRRGSYKQGLLEIAKCELVCANCHRLRTKRRQTLRDVSSGSFSGSYPEGR